jgi:serine/threonine protein kinase
MSIGAHGVVIPGYRDLAPIGEGASGTIFRARDEALHRSVAIKVLRTADPAGPEGRRFEQEKELHARLAGLRLGIVPVFHAGATPDGHPYLVMELYEGSVQDHLAREGSFPEADAVEIMLTVAEAVAGAHGLGVVHGDIKPENVLLSAQGAALSDFGIARIVPRRGRRGESDDRSGGLTPRHAAPEVLDGSSAATERSDIWSLGSTLYTMLTCRPPFEPQSGESLERFALRIRREPTPRVPYRHLSPGLEELIGGALDPDPSRRPTSAAEVAERLAELAGRRPSIATTTAYQPGTAPTEPDQDILDAPSGPAMEIPDGHTLHREPRPSEPVDDDPHGEDGTDRAERKVSRTLLALAGSSVALLLAVIIAKVALGGGEGDDQVIVPDDPERAEVVEELAPTDVSVDDYDDTVTLHWTDNADGQLAYAVVYRGIGTEQMVMNVDRGASDLTIRGLDPDLGYCFRIVGIGEDANGKEVQTSADVSVRGCEPEPVAP